jgi:hypothetical protein
MTLSANGMTQHTTSGARARFHQHGLQASLVE